MTGFGRLAPALALAFVTTAGLAAQSPANTPPDDANHINFDGPYTSCAAADTLRQSGPLDIGVHFATANPHVAVGFRRALDFWAKVIELRWHETDAAHCSLTVIDGQPDIFPGATYALGQFPGWQKFAGRIAFDGRIIDCVPDDELFATAVHEIGHILGLTHNANPGSIMYWTSEEFHGALSLDAADLRQLETLHALRRHVPDPQGVFVLAAVTPPGP